MEREQLDRLLAEYATGGLSEEERKALFAAALQDQELFDQLMEEEALREAIELPGARNRLIDALQEEEVPVAPMQRMPAAAAPSRLSKSPPRLQSTWLAWAAGIGVVFVSGAVTYMMFDRPELAKMAQVTSSAPRDTKPFVPPPSAAVPQKPKPVVVDEPPKIMAENRVPLPQAVNIPLPAAPPPPPAKVAAEAVADKPAGARNEVVAEFRAQQTQQTATAPAPSQQVAPAAPALARRQTAPSGGMAASSAIRDVAKEREASPLSAWRRTGDGVWVRVPAGDAVGRVDPIVIRYVPRTATRVVLMDERGQRLAQRDGRAGEELELPVPQAAMATGDALALRVVEEARERKVVGRVARADEPSARIILRLR
jgi:hypothetical protein